MSHQTELKIEGMHCAGCVSTVEKALSKVIGVQRAVVSLELEKAAVNGRVEISQLIKAVEMSGYTASSFIEEGLNKKSSTQKQDKVKKRMIVGWAATVPIMIWMGIAMAGGLLFPTPKVYHAGMLILSAITIFYAGGETIRNGWKSLYYFNPNMDALITIGCLAAWSTGWIRIWIDIQPFTGIAGMIMSFHLTGRYIESKARGAASSAIKKLMNLEAKKAVVINKNGSEIMVDIRDISVGDVVIVRAGETISADGIVLEGIADVDESLVTGEPIPISKTKEDLVVGGTICLNSTLRIKVEKTGKDTFLSKVVKLVENTQTTKVPIQLFADKVIAIFVPIVLVLSGVTFVLWYFFPEHMLSVSISISRVLPFIAFESTPLAQALYSSIAVLVIACPCALGLATPTALVAGTGLGAKNGVLIRDGAAVQKLTQADIIFFDKTGTITEGKMEVTGVRAVDSIKTEDLVQLAASLEKESSHPLAMAVVEHANTLNIDLVKPEQVKVFPGRGIEGIVAGKNIKAGSRDFVGGVSRAKEDKMSIYISCDQKEIGCIYFKDHLRKEAKGIVSSLKEKNLTPVILTGDKKEVAENTGKQLGINTIHAQLSPESKLDIISSYQKKGHVVVMVGDGINDAPALTQADVGIAMGSGTDIALESGDIVLTGKEMENIFKTFLLCYSTFKKIRQNIFWSYIYNIIAIPLAFLGLLHPVVAEAAMAASSISVVLNSSGLAQKGPFK
tara:strand:+ start:74980 stop:77175 length:2196 start_codon:yes stop_codon:yes gene_type:complete